MAGPNGLTRGRILLIAIGVLVLAALAGLWQWGNGALTLDRGGLATTGIAADGAYGSLALGNDSDHPVTLKEFRPGTLENAEVLRAAVVRAPRDAWLVLSSPLPASAQAVVDAGTPVDGFVVPARSSGQYRIVYLLKPLRTSRTASIAGGTVVYSAITGIGHTARTAAAVCLRASSGACPAG